MEEHHDTEIQNIQKVCSSSTTGTTGKWYLLEATQQYQHKKGPSNLKCWEKLRIYGTCLLVKKRNISSVSRKKKINWIKDRNGQHRK
jgi:hypothetical protein